MRKYLILLFALVCGSHAQEARPCVFCEIVKGEREVSTVYRDGQVMAFVDHAPVNPGHVLVIPIEHGETLNEVPAETAREMMGLAQRIGAAYQKTDLKAEAFQLHMNNGRLVQHVRHAHLHVWPRFAGDFPGDAVVRLASQRTRIERPEMDAVAAKLKTGLELMDLYSSFYEERLKLFPFEATEAGDPRYNDRLPNFLSDEHRASVRAFYEKHLARIKSFDRASLTPKEQVSYDTLEWDCEIGLATLQFRTDLLPIDQFNSLHLHIGVWAGGTSAQPFKTVADYENWLKRLDGFAAWSATALERMREGMAAGYVLPKALAQKVVPQLANLTVGPAEKHSFYAPIEKFPESFSAEDRERLAAAYAEKIRGKIIPAFATLHAFMTTEYLPACRESSGISEIPQGREYYEHQIKSFTTTDITADDVFELGQREVKRILAEMEGVKKQVGFEGTIREFFDHVRTRKELMPFSDPSQVIENFNAIHKKMQPKLEKQFDLVPKTPFEVRRTESFREASASAEYMPGSMDGTRAGIFYVPIPKVEEYNVCSDEALFLHEAIPGHHYQIALQREDKSLPQFRRILWYSAYGEGWALYCESLGKELGLYDDPYQYFGMLSAEMHRAIRLVVDPGLHAKGWTREQAIQFSLDHEAETEASVIAEIERYMAWPGQALSYKIGQLKIRELRAGAEKSLGKDFDIREFHTQVLESGCIPLKVLEKKIDRWIEAKKGK